jgi:hypothetical protein
LTKSVIGTGGLEMKRRPVHQIHKWAVGLFVLAFAVFFCINALAADLKKAEIDAIKAKIVKPVDFKPVTGGTWGEAGGSLYQLAMGGNIYGIMGDPAWEGDFTLECKARRLSGKEGFLILFRVQDDKNFCWWSVGGWGNTQSAVERKVDGDGRILEITDHSVVPGQWHDIKIEAKGDFFRFYFDGKLIYEVEELDMTSGGIGFGTWDTLAEFTDVKYTDGKGTVLFTSNFTR